MGAGDRPLLSRKTAVLAVLAAALLVAVVLLKGSDQGAGGGAPRPASEPPPEGGERPVDARPQDPRKRSNDRPPPARPAPPPPAETRARPAISVRVVDPAGKPRGGIPIDLVAAAPGGNPGRPLDATRISDASGALAFPWPKAGSERDLLISAGMVLEEPLAVPVPRGGKEPVEIRIPESGEVAVSVTGADGSPFREPCSFLVLVATNDPWASPAALERASRPAVDGKARIPLVEAGTLLLVEGRTPGRRFTMAPRLIEGPAREGATVETVLVARNRDPSESRPSDPRFVPSRQGPPATAPAMGPKDGSVRFSVRPRDVLPQWPLIVQVGLRAAAAATLDRGARVDPRGAATVVAAAGRYAPAARLWRAMPDGWVTADFELVPAGQPAIDVAAGRQQQAGIALDPQALALAAAALMAW